MYIKWRDIGWFHKVSMGRYWQSKQWVFHPKLDCYKRRRIVCGVSKQPHKDNCPEGEFE